MGNQRAVRVKGLIGLRELRWSDRFPTNRLTNELLLATFAAVDRQLGDHFIHIDVMRTARNLGEHLTFKS